MELDRPFGAVESRTANESLTSVQAALRAADEIAAALQAHLTQEPGRTSKTARRPSRRRWTCYGTRARASPQGSGMLRSNALEAAPEIGRAAVTTQLGEYR